MFKRRDFLKLAAAAWPASALPQAAKKDKPPPGILVNDVHSQLNSTRVWRIVQPDTLDGVRSAIKAAQKEEEAGLHLRRAPRHGRPAVPRRRR